MAEQTNLIIKKNEDKKVLKKEDEGIPTYQTRIAEADLTQGFKDRIIKEIQAEIDVIKRERDEIKLEDTLDALDRQYEGEMREIANMQFNVSRKTTAIKINAVERALNEAFFEGDHVFTVTPRPEFEGSNGREVTEKQEDFLDYKIDEVIPLEETMSKVFHAAALKFGGILKITQKYKTKKRKTNETYAGEWKPVLDPRGRPQMDKNTGQPAMKNEGLEEFLRAYPDAAEKYPNHVKALSDGKTLDLVIEYNECVYDDPLPQFVDMKNFFVRKNVDGIDGLRDTYLKAERKEYTYWELLQEEKEERLFDIDELIYEGKDKDKPKNDRTKIENYANQTYELYRCVFNTKIKDEDEEYTQCVFHVNLERKSVHGADYYPYWGVDTEYIPFWVKDKEVGFYKKGLGEDLKDLHLAQNILLCLALESAYNAALITPICMEGSPVAAQFQEKSFTTGDPLIIRNKNDIPDFLNKYFRPPDVGSLMQLGTFLGQEAGNIVGVSDAWATGNADPIDPSAPAQKTRDLLRQAGINIRDYIKVLGRSFNEVGNVLMQMYYQRNQKSYRYRNSRRGVKEFKEISRSDMAAKTNFQTMAFAFDVDKLNQKREMLALWNTIRVDRAFNRNEKAVHFAMKMLIKGWGPMFKNNIDKLMPSIEEFERERIKIAVQAVAIYMQQETAKANAAGQQPQLDPRQVMPILDQMLRESMTEPSEEEVKAREQGVA